MSFFIIYVSLSILEISSKSETWSPEPVRFAMEHAIYRFIYIYFRFIRTASFLKRAQPGFYVKSALKPNQISHRLYGRGWARDDFAKFSDPNSPFWMSNDGFYHFRLLRFLAKLIIGKFWKKSGLFFPIKDTFVIVCRFFYA